MASRSVARAAGDRPDLRAQHLHAQHVGPLPANVFLAHVDDAFESEAGTGRGRGHAVLAGARLAITRGLPMRRVSSAWPSVLLIL